MPAINSVTFQIKLDDLIHNDQAKIEELTRARLPKEDSKYADNFRYKVLGHCPPGIEDDCGCVVVTASYNLYLYRKEK